jgi:phosphohistidine phosphatase
MRHAKAEPYASSDHARRLTERGRRDSAAAGRHLVTAGLLPDHAVVSGAARARETWDEMTAAAGHRVEAQYDEAVYAGGPDAVLEVLHAVPADVGTLLFIGHNPTVSALAHLLDDGRGEPEAVTGLLGGFPPGAMVALELTVPWGDLEPETARVVDFFAPAGR